PGRRLRQMEVERLRLDQVVSGFPGARIDISRRTHHLVCDAIGLSLEGIARLTNHQFGHEPGKALLAAGVALSVHASGATARALAQNERAMDRRRRYGRARRRRRLGGRGGRDATHRVIAPRTEEATCRSTWAPEVADPR